MGGRGRGRRPDIQRPRCPHDRTGHAGGAVTGARWEPRPRTEARCGTGGRCRGLGFGRRRNRGGSATEAHSAVRGGLRRACGRPAGTARIAGLRFSAVQRVAGRARPEGLSHLVACSLPHCWNRTCAHIGHVAPNRTSLRGGLRCGHGREVRSQMVCVDHPGSPERSGYRAPDASRAGWAAAAGWILSMLRVNSSSDRPRSESAFVNMNGAPLLRALIAPRYSLITW
jgi:hypothetical protein